ncbi:MAG TPA: hypothetical protein VKU01_09365 [Bryobacteraceae bacterium]|nr:hypothetical protein [Bryobacteraceae bacterium]
MMAKTTIAGVFGPIDSHDPPIQRYVSATASLMQPIKLSANTYHLTPIRHRVNP